MDGWIQTHVLKEKEQMRNFIAAYARFFLYMWFRMDCRVCFFLFTLLCCSLMQSLCRESDAELSITNCF